MICPNCSSENPTSHRFCIHCGTPLPSGFQESEPRNDESLDKDAITNANTSQDNQQEQLRTLQNDVKAIRDTLAGHGIVVPTRTLDQTRKQPHSNVSSSQASEQIASDNLDVPKKPREHKTRNPSQISWEIILGGNWLARIGMIAVIMGTGFFLKLAFDNDWIGEIGQVVIGVIGGLIFLYCGVYWQKKYPQYSQALSGGGIAILYLSIFAAVGPFELINFYPAMGLFLLISITAAGLAIRQESLTLAIIGIIGAFSAPLITTGFFEESNEGIDLAAKTILTGPSWHLMAYVIVIDIGVLALSTFRHWRWFTLLGLLGSLVTFTAWRDFYSDEISLLISQASLTIIFLIFVAATTLFHIIWRRPPKVYDQSLMGINAIAFFGMSYDLLSKDFNDWMGVFSVSMSIFYGTIAYIFMLKNRGLVQLSVMSVGIALIFLTIAIPIQLNGAWVTVAWATEAVILIWISFTLRMWQMRIFSIATFSILSVRLIAEIQVNIEDFQVILNHRMLAFASGILAFYVAAYIVRIHYASLMNWEKQKLLPGLLLMANALSLLIISVEMITLVDANIVSFSESTANHIKSLGLSLLWAIYASILIVIGIIRKVHLIRLAGLILLAIPIIKLFIFDSFALEQGYRVAAFISLGGLLICGGFLYQRFNVVIKGFLSENQSHSS